MNRQTSQQFQSFGAVGAPTSIGELRIAMVRTKPYFLLTILLSQIWSLVLSVIKQTAADFAAATGLPETSSTYDLSPRPTLVITINPKSSENKVHALETAGFAPRSNGRYKYYAGPATDLALRAAVKEGVATDAFAPGNSVSVNGLILFSVMSRILYHAFIVLSSLPTVNSLADITTYTPAAVSDAFKLTESRLDQLPAKGFFFPYFDGLLLPDNGVTLTTFVKVFSPLFGKTPAVIAEATKTFASGWSTLSRTIAGKEYSHMVYCIDTAISCGISARPVYLAGQYAGCVFDTADCIVHIGSQIHVPQDTQGLKTGVERMQSHESSLEEICAILTEVDKDADESEDVRVISPHLITSARSLHYAFKTRTLGPDTQAKLAPLIRKLRFEQKLWDITNPKHVQSAVAFITTKTFPDQSVPMNMRIDAMFTKQPIYSVLGAFGTKAPSLRGTGTQIVRRIAPKFYESLDKPGRLVGIPVFAKSHQEAKEDWEAILNEFTVFFDTKGKDKEGKLRVKGVTSFIPFDTDEYRGIQGSLLTLMGKGKRRRVESDDTVGATQEEIDQDAKRKRRKEKGFGMMGLTFGLHQGESGMDVDAENDDIFT